MTPRSPISGAAPTARIRLTEVSGSAPRAAGTTMLVSAEAAEGTIGGGQLEYMAIEEARAMLAAGEDRREMNVPLGPEIGQCCGGRVKIVLDRLDEAGLRAERQASRQAQDDWPQVLIFGAGHVGRALSAALLPLPVQARLIDTRAAEIALAPRGVEVQLTSLPEAEVRSAGPGTAYVILTHDHSLDFLIAAEALERGDAAYVGMIGSETKRASFAGFCRREAPGADPARLTCPIGAGGTRDKRPEVIAALVAAELMTALLTQPAEAVSVPTRA